MKVLSIGRDAGCSICCDNPMISRRHALLKVYQNGKIELISLGKNGTFVNGILCKQNVPYPIKRKDVVSFAHACELDWSLVPNPLVWVKYAIIGLASVIAITIVCVVGVKVSELFDTSQNTPEIHETSTLGASESDEEKGNRDIEDNEQKEEEGGAYNFNNSKAKNKSKTKTKKELVKGFNWGNSEKPEKKVENNKKEEKKKIEESETNKEEKKKEDTAKQEKQENQTIY